MNVLYFILESIFSGILVSMGGIAYVLNPSIVGALMFSFALCTIVLFKLPLYTGRIGYLNLNILDYGIMLFSNLLGTYLVAGLVYAAPNFHTKLMPQLLLIVENRLGFAWYETLILGVFCGILMFIAVECGKQENQKFMIIMCVTVFISSNFLHCIADSFYFSAALGSAPLDYLVPVVLGNSIGGILARFILKNPTKKETN